MNAIKNIFNIEHRPITVGVLSIFAIVLIGVSLAFATGIANPVKTFADDFGDIGGLSGITNSPDERSLDIGTGADTGDLGSFDDCTLTNSDGATPPDEGVTAPCNCDNAPTDTGSTPPDLTP